MKIIHLTQGKEALVDDDDYARLSAYKWQFNTKNKNGHGYAQRSQHVKLGYKKYTNKTVYMHREILVTDLEVDHINGNTLDNRKQNLRPVNRILQTRNTSSRRNSTSKYVGVHLHRLTGKWRSQIKISGKRVDLGLFNTEEAAFLARKKYIEDNNLKGFKTCV